jgi:hypothetical protein
MTLSLSVSPNEIRHLSITGVLDAQTASQLELMLDTLFVHAFPRVEIDFGPIRTVDVPIRGYPASVPRCGRGGPLTQNWPRRV